MLTDSDNLSPNNGLGLIAANQSGDNLRLRLISRLALLKAKFATWFSSLRRNESHESLNSEQSTSSRLSSPSESTKNKLTLNIPKTPPSPSTHQYVWGRIMATCATIARMAITVSCSLSITFVATSGMPIWIGIIIGAAAFYCLTPVYWDDIPLTLRDLPHIFKRSDNSHQRSLRRKQKLALVIAFISSIALGAKSFFPISAMMTKGLIVFGLMPQTALITAIVLTSIILLCAVIGLACNTYKTFDRFMHDKKVVDRVLSLLKPIIKPVKRLLALTLRQLEKRANDSPRLTHWADKIDVDTPLTWTDLAKALRSLVILGTLVLGVYAAFTTVGSWAEGLEHFVNNYLYSLPQAIHSVWDAIVFSLMNTEHAITLAGRLFYTLYIGYFVLDYTLTAFTGGVTRFWLAPNKIDFIKQQASYWVSNPGETIVPTFALVTNALGNGAIGYDGDVNPLFGVEVGHTQAVVAGAAFSGLICKYSRDKDDVKLHDAINDIRAWPTTTDDRTDFILQPPTNLIDWLAQQKNLLISKGQQLEQTSDAEMTSTSSGSSPRSNQSALVATQESETNLQQINLQLQDINTIQQALQRFWELPVWLRLELCALQEHLHLQNIFNPEFAASNANRKTIGQTVFGINRELTETYQLQPQTNYYVARTQHAGEQARANLYHAYCQATLFCQQRLSRAEQSIAPTSTQPYLQLQ